MAGGSCWNVDASVAGFVNRAATAARLAGSLNPAIRVAADDGAEVRRIGYVAGEMVVSEHDVVDVPVAVGGALCLPGDFVIADDDGPVIVPRRLAPELRADVRDHQEWEVFSRSRIDEGARLSDYYPLTPDSRQEYEAWRAARA